MSAELYLFISIIGAILFVASLDDWSTVTLLSYQHLLINNKEVHDFYENKDKTEGITRYEMNRFARYFFKKYGLRTGKRIFNLIVRVPLLSLLIILVFIGIFPFLSLWTFAYFYGGILFGQVLRALHAKRTLKKDLDINISDYAKENLK